MDESSINSGKKQSSNQEESKELLPISGFSNYQAMPNLVPTKTSKNKGSRNRNFYP